MAAEASLKEQLQQDKATLQQQVKKAHDDNTALREQLDTATEAVAKAHADNQMMRAERAETSWFGRWSGCAGGAGGVTGRGDAGRGDGGRRAADDDDDDGVAAAMYKPVAVMQHGCAAGFVVKHQTTGALFLAKMGLFEVGEERIPRPFKCGDVSTRRCCLLLLLLLLPPPPPPPLLLPPPPPPLLLPLLLLLLPLLRSRVHGTYARGTFTAHTTNTHTHTHRRATPWQRHLGAPAPAPSLARWCRW